MRMALFTRFTKCLEGHVVDLDSTRCRSPIRLLDSSEL